MKYLFKHVSILKVFYVTARVFAVGALLYLAILPLYPRIIFETRLDIPEPAVLAKESGPVREEISGVNGYLPKAEYKISENRLIIRKIGVNAPVVENPDPEEGLSLGSWHEPESSTPDRGGNTVLTGHRFKYLPPNNLTFYLLDKLEKGDIITALWNGKAYHYKVKEIKIVPGTDISILDPSDDPVLTLYTCDPIYSSKNRLVVLSDLFLISDLAQ